MARGDKPYLRKSTDRKAQISPLNWTNAFLIQCDRCQSTNLGEASGCACRFAFRKLMMSGAGQFSLFTDDLLYVLSKCASPQKLKLCPECCLERKSRASILDWVSIGKPKFSFSFCLFGERRKGRRRRERKWKVIMDRNLEKSVVSRAPPSDYHWVRLALVFDLRFWLGGKNLQKGRLVNQRASLVVITMGQL